MFERTIISSAVALLTMTVGCGGAEWATRPAEELVAASAAVLELDLPGCDCAALPPSATLLRHPAAADLVVAVVEGTPTCVDTLQSAFIAMRPRDRLTGPRGAGLSVAFAFLNTVSDTAPEDDPVPILPDQDRDREDEQTEGDGPATDGAGGPPGPQAMSSASDDPVPIRDGQPAMVAASLLVKTSK